MEWKVIPKNVYDLSDLKGNILTVIDRLIERYEAYVANSAHVDFHARGIALVDFFKELPDYSTELYTHKKMKTNDEIALSSLQAALPVLENLSDWNETAIHDSLMALVGELGIKNGQLLWPVRTALSGEQTSPGGAMELADILGKEEALRRIRKGIEKLSK